MQGEVFRITKQGELSGLIDAGPKYRALFYFEPKNVAGGLPAFLRLEEGDPVGFDRGLFILRGPHKELIRALNVKKL